MRTAIYVYATSASATEFSLNADAVITKFEGPTGESKVENDNGRCMLSPGIYKVVGDLPVIRLPPGSIAEFDVVAISNDKDPWPDPPPKFQSTFSDVSLDVLRGFLPMASGAFGEFANDLTK
jgi:hypothetical protein